MNFGTIPELFEYNRNNPKKKKGKPGHSAGFGP
jgi:hypothetical protein